MLGNLGVDVGNKSASSPGPRGYEIPVLDVFLTLPKVAERAVLDHTLVYCRLLRSQMTSNGGSYQHPSWCGDDHQTTFDEDLRHFGSRYDGAGASSGLVGLFITPDLGLNPLSTAV